jgi:hypothetical protein
MRQLEIAYAEYVELRETAMGYCVRCGDFTRESVEPDATGYECPTCEHDTVVGAEIGLIRGDFEISEEF